MGSNTIGASGVALPPPQALYPVTIGNIPGLAGTNRIALPPGGDFLLPSGTWLVAPGPYSILQVLDPVSNTWLPYDTGGTNTSGVIVNSDGVNYRIINPTGFPIGAVVTNAGSGYTSAPVVAAGAGGSTWLAIVGGGIGALDCPSTATAASGSGYAVPPLLNIAAPATPGVQATATCTISGGSIASFTITNNGAGYTSVPTVVAIPQASDLNTASTSTTRVVNATVTARTSFVGQVTAVLLTNEGNNPQTTAPALTFTGGGGANAAATTIMAFTVTNYAASTVGSGYAAGGAFVSTFGGSLATQSSGQGLSSPASPALSNQLLVPRQAQILAKVSGSGIAANGDIFGGIIDGGLFQTPPSAFVVNQPTGLSGLATVAVVSVSVGSVSDVVFVTPL